MLMLMLMLMMMLMMLMMLMMMIGRHKQHSHSVTVSHDNATFSPPLFSCFCSGSTSPPPSHSSPLQSPAKSKPGVLKTSPILGPVAGGVKASLPMMRYSGIQDDNDHHYRPSQHLPHAANQPSHLHRDVSERNYRDVSEWAASPEPLTAGGKAQGVAVRKVAQRAAAGAVAVGAKAKDRDSSIVPDLPPRLGGSVARGGAAPAAGRAEWGAGKISVSNVEFQNEGLLSD